MPEPGVAENFPAIWKTQDPAALPLRDGLAELASARSPAPPPQSEGDNSSAEIPNPTYVRDGGPALGDRAGLVEDDGVDLRELSRALRVFISTPAALRARWPTMIAVGVARPSAQGQAMMRTDTKRQQRHGQARFAGAANRTRRQTLQWQCTSQPARNSPRWCRPGVESAPCCLAPPAPSARSAATQCLCRPSSRASRRRRSVQRRAEYHIARFLLHRPGSPVSMDSSTRRPAIQHFAVNRHFLAGPHQDDIAQPHLLDGNVLLAPVALDARGLGLQAHQGADRAACLGARSRFEQAAHQNQRDDNRRRSRNRRRPCRVHGMAAHATLPCHRVHRSKKPRRHVTARL